MAINQPTPIAGVFHLPLRGRRNGRNGVTIGHTLVQDDEFSRTYLTMYRWSVRNGYAARKGVVLHQLIYRTYHGSVPTGWDIDHINRDRLDNRAANLRAVPRVINILNREWRKGRSGFRGVIQLPSGRWQAAVGRDYLGSFDTAEDAARAVNRRYRINYPELPVPNPEVEPEPLIIPPDSLPMLKPLIPISAGQCQNGGIYLLPITGQRGSPRRRTVVGFAKVADDEFTRTHLVPYFWNCNGAGYFVRRGFSGERIYVHRIVAEHYHGAIPSDAVVDHIDRNKANCLPSNLRIVTQKENMAGVERINGRWAPL